MLQYRDYVTMTELAITTGLDHATIRHVLSFLTDFEVLMSIRPDTWIRQCDMRYSEIYLVLSDSKSYMERFCDVNNHRLTDKYMMELVDMCIKSTSERMLICVIKLNDMLLYGDMCRRIASFFIKLDSVEWLIHMIGKMCRTSELVVAMGAMMIRCTKYDSVNCLKYLNQTLHNLHKTYANVVENTICESQHSTLYGTHHHNYMDALWVLCGNKHSWRCIEYIANEMIKPSNYHVVTYREPQQTVYTFPTWSLNAETSLQTLTYN